MEYTEGSWSIQKEHGVYRRRGMEYIEEEAWSIQKKHMEYIQKNHVRFWLVPCGPCSAPGYVFIVQNGHEQKQQRQQRQQKPFKSQGQPTDQQPTHQLYYLQQLWFIQQQQQQQRTTPTSWAARGKRFLFSSSELATQSQKFFSCKAWMKTVGLHPYTHTYEMR